MPPISRRDVLKAAAAVGLVPLLPACGDSGVTEAPGPGFEPPPTPVPVAATFLHGVASGDPLAVAVILWTRLTPELPGVAAVPLRWLLAEDELLTRVVRQGEALAEAGRDYTVKLDVDGLAPGRT